jgi:hypothetical protein
MSRSPTFGGVPDKIRLGDWLLVEWVATAKPGDPFPEPWCHAHSPLQSMIFQLTELRVIERPAPETPVSQVAHEATAAAQRWIAEHPRPDPGPQDVVRRMEWRKPPVSP